MEAGAGHAPIVAGGLGRRERTSAHRRGTTESRTPLITLRGVSRLLRPVGPLAPHVYWLRRIMVVAIAAVLVFAAAKMVGAVMPDDRVNAAASDASTPRPAQTLAPKRDEQSGPGGGSGSDSDPGDEGPSDAGSRGGRDSSGAGSKPGPSGSRPGGGNADGSAAPDSEGSAGGGPDTAEPGADEVDATNVSDDAEPTSEPRSLPVCLTEDVGVSAALSAAEVEAGSGLKLTAELVNETDSPCRVEVNPITLQLQVVSGSDRVWTSAHCPILIPTGPLTLQPDEPRPLSVDWPGTRSGPECAEDQPEAQPGHYEARATLGDLISAPEPFRVI